METPSVNYSKLQTRSARKRQRVDPISDGISISLSSQLTPPPTLIYTVSSQSPNRQEYDNFIPSSLMLSPSQLRYGSQSDLLRNSNTNTRTNEIYTRQYSSIHVAKNSADPPLSTIKIDGLDNLVEWVTLTSTNTNYSPLCMKHDTEEDDEGLSHSGRLPSSCLHRQGTFDSSYTYNDSTYATTFDSASSQPVENTETCGVSEVGYRNTNQFPQEEFMEEREDDLSSWDNSDEKAREKFFRILDYNTCIASSNAYLMKNAVGGIHNHLNTFHDEEFPDQDSLDDRLTLSDFVKQPSLKPHVYGDNEIASSAIGQAAFEQEVFITKIIEPMNLQMKCVVSELEPIHELQLQYSDKMEDRWYAQTSLNIDGVYYYQPSTGDISRTEPVDYMDTSDVRRLAELKAKARLSTSIHTPIKRSSSAPLQLLDLDLDDQFINSLSPMKQKKLTGVTRCVERRRPSSLRIATIVLLLMIAMMGGLYSNFNCDDDSPYYMIFATGTVALLWNRVEAIAIATPPLTLPIHKEDILPCIGTNDRLQNTVLYLQASLSQKCIISEQECFEFSSTYFPVSAQISHDSFP